MILITSAAYVRSDLRAEFGEIPPAFLPIGNRPIVSHQIAHLKDAFPGEPITLSLPEGYRLSESNR